jgi:hypothetical protein
LTIVVDNGDGIIGEERGLELSTLETNMSKTNTPTLEPNQSSVKYAYDRENEEGRALASQSKIINTLMISPGTQKEPRKDVDKSEVTNLCKYCFCFH